MLQLPPELCQRRHPWWISCLFTTNSSSRRATALHVGPPAVEQRRACCLVEFKWSSIISVWSGDGQRMSARLASCCSVLVIRVSLHWLSPLSTVGRECSVVEFPRKSVCRPDHNSQHSNHPRIYFRVCPIYPRGKQENKWILPGAKR